MTGKPKRTTVDRGLLVAVEEVTVERLNALERLMSGLFSEYSDSRLERIRASEDPTRAFESAREIAYEIDSMEARLRNILGLPMPMVSDFEISPLALRNLFAHFNPESVLSDIADFESDPVKVGDIFRVARLDLGMGRVESAGMIGTSQTKLTHFEKGKSMQVEDSKRILNWLTILFERLVELSSSEEVMEIRLEVAENIKLVTKALPVYESDSFDSESAKQLADVVRDKNLDTELLRILIDTIRKKEQWNQTEFGKRLGVSQSKMSCLLSGEIAAHDLNSVRAFVLSYLKKFY